MLELIFEFCEALNNFLAFGLLGFVMDGVDSSVDVVKSACLNYVSAVKGCTIHE
jgi:hypothetical protein